VDTKSYKLLDKFITAYNNKYNGNASNYDALILKLLPEKHHEKADLYERLLSVILFLLTDGNALSYLKQSMARKGLIKIINDPYSNICLSWVLGLR
jgi:hypothetical protein